MVSQDYGFALGPLGFSLCPRFRGFPFSEASSTLCQHRFSCPATLDERRIIEPGHCAAFGQYCLFSRRVFVLLAPPITRRIVELANEWRLPAIYQIGDFVDMGGLMSYGPDGHELFRQAAVYVDRILKGANPADMPVQQPTKFELEINLRTAKLLGLTIPDSILALTKSSDPQAPTRPPMTLGNMREADTVGALLQGGVRT